MVDAGDTAGIALAWRVASTAGEPIARYSAAIEAAAAVKWARRPPIGESNY